MEVEQKQTTWWDSTLPAEAPLFDGVAVEKSIDGFRTINVEGRGPLGYEIDAESVDGLDGQHFIDAVLKVREVKITYRIKAATSAELSEKLDKLQALITGKERNISFNDQSKWFARGTVSDSEDPESGLLEANGSYTITFSDPHKYSATQSLSGTSIDFGSKTGQLISIEYTPTATATNITITSSKGYAIKLVNGTVNAGDTIVLKPQDQTVTLNGVNKAMWLTYDTDFENVPAAGKLTVSPAGSLKVTFKEVR